MIVFAYITTVIVGIGLSCPLPFSALCFNSFQGTFDVTKLVVTVHAFGTQSHPYEPGFIERFVVAFSFLPLLRQSQPARVDVTFMVLIVYFFRSLTDMK